MNKQRLTAQESGKRARQAIMASETELIIPDSIDTERHIVDFQPHELCIQIKGFYVNQNGIIALLRANKNNPNAIQYIADMME